MEEKILVNKEALEALISQCQCYADSLDSRSCIIGDSSRESYVNELVEKLYAK